MRPAAGRGLGQGFAEARGAFAYPAMVLAEEWIEGVENVLERLRLLLEGDGVVAGQRVHGRFAGTYSERNVHLLAPLCRCTFS